MEYRMPSIGELARQFEKLLDRKNKAAADTREVSGEIESLEQELLDKMADEGMPSMRLESGKTLYTRVDKFYAIKYPDGATEEQKAETKQEFIRALADCPDTSDIVKRDYNAATLRSRIKEIEENGEQLDPSVLNLISVIEKPRISYRS
jgi:hypothetical protein